MRIRFSILLSAMVFSMSNGQICSESMNLDIGHLIKIPKRTKANPDKVVSLYLETDLYTRNQLGSDAATEAWLQEQYLYLAFNYANEGISTSLTETHWGTNSNEDWSDGLINNPFLLLNTFAQIRQNSPSGRMKLFVSMNGFQQGLAWIDVLQSNYFTFTQDGVLNHAGPYSVNLGLSVNISNWNQIVLTHELGHNMGSPHTNRCVWGDGNDVLDRCQQPENCMNAQLSPNAQDDTMMSNCPQNNFVQNGFGIEPGNLIRSKVDNAVIDLTGGHCAKIMYLADNIAGNYYATQEVIFHPGVDSEGMCVFSGCP